MVLTFFQALLQVCVLTRLIPDAQLHALTGHRVAAVALQPQAIGSLTESAAFTAAGVPVLGPQLRLDEMAAHLNENASESPCRRRHHR
jgi:hypothetical protein